jgi:hypothetical protein
VGDIEAEVNDEALLSSPQTTTGRCTPLKDPQSSVYVHCAMSYDA